MGELRMAADEQVEALTSQLTNLKNELKKTSLEKDNLAKKVERIAGEKNSALEGEIEEREKTISDKEAEICDLKQLSDIKERQLKCDIEREVEEKVKVTNKLNAEIDTIKSEISKKETQISKIEKEKREISIAQDKRKKKKRKGEKKKKKKKKKKK